MTAHNGQKLPLNDANREGSRPRATAKFHRGLVCQRWHTLPRTHLGNTCILLRVLDSNLDESVAAS